MHYAAYCPHRDDQQENAEDSIPTLLATEVNDSVDDANDLLEDEFIPALFANNIHEKYKDCFTGEALHSAILDSGCRRTVCGRLWYECFLESLPLELLGKVEENETSAKFRFGDRVMVPSMKSSRIPCSINGMSINIQTEVIDNEIPLLLSKEAMK